MVLRTVILINFDMSQTARLRPTHSFSPSRQAIASSSTLTASSTAITGRAWNSKAGKVEYWRWKGGPKKLRPFGIAYEACTHS